MSKLTVEISFNDLKELILDKNGRMPVKLRNSIAQQFSQKYLKGVIDDEMKKELRDFISEEIKKMIKEEPDWYGDGLKFKNHIEEGIIKKVENICRKDETNNRRELNQKYIDYLKELFDNIKSDSSYRVKNLEDRIVKDSHDIIEKKIEEKIDKIVKGLMK